MSIGRLEAAMAARCLILSRRSSSNLVWGRSSRFCPMGLAACVALVALFAGCGGDGLYHLSGKVTFNGQAIPEGYIVFEPDGSKGNTGQSGRSTIRDGEYDTSDADGMAVVGGPHVIRVVAHSEPINPDVAVGGEVVMPPLMFPPYTFNQDLPLEDSVVDFEIPAEAAKK